MTLRPALLRWLSAFIALSLLTACGFQLRGSYQVPQQLSQVSMEAPTRSELASRLQDVLSEYEIPVVARHQDVTHIELLDDSLDRRVLSLLISGQVAEYELIYTASLRVHMQDGRVEHHDIQIYRDYQEDPNFALAKTRELDILLDEMRDDAVNRIMLLLTRLTWGD